MTHRNRGVDVIAERVVAGLMRRRWTPVGMRLTISLDESDDVSLSGVRRNAVIRAYDLQGSGALTRLLVQLEVPLIYCGQHAAAKPFTATELEWLVAEPCAEGLPHASRLLLFVRWHARLVDAPSFTASTGRQPIGIARLRKGFRKYPQKA